MYKDSGQGQSYDEHAPLIRLLDLPDGYKGNVGHMQTGTKRYNILDWRYGNQWDENGNIVFHISNQYSHDERVRMEKKWKPINLIPFYKKLKFFTNVKHNTEAASQPHDVILKSRWEKLYIKCVL